MSADAIELEIFKHLFASICEEMGVRLMRSAYSPNIKERRDHSCALFDANAEMVAQAAHIPVHLGSTPMSVQAAIDHIGLDAMEPGELIVLNDPFAGGTHLPDITLVAPCVLPGESRPRFFVANRAHHADVGGISPGSMPLSTHIDQEGLRLTPTRLDEATRARIYAASRTPDERQGDLQAQIAAARLGVTRLQALCARYGPELVAQRARDLQDYAERLMRATLRAIPDGVYTARDVMDDDGVGGRDIPIACTLHIEGASARVDLTECAPQSPGPINAVRAIALSAVNYAFRCLGPDALPSNGGTMRPIEVLTRPGTLLDAEYPAAVAAGNVETSQRIVDVVLRALASALPDRIPAASCGSMNNLTIGGHDPRHGGAPFAYYETLAGGAGAGPDGPGADAVHTHMTNTLNTPVEALEHAYPMRVETYRIRSAPPAASDALHAGGSGLERVYRFDAPAEVTLLTERRLNPPYGLAGAPDGAPGVNTLIHADGTSETLPPKATLTVQPGQALSVKTPGGGHWGKKSP